MKTYLKCIPCFFKQAIAASIAANADPKKQKQIIDKVCQKVKSFKLTTTPPEMGSYIYGIVREITGNNDPYKKIKHKTNAIAFSVYGKLRKKVRKSKDPLFTAVRIAIAGNIIDYGAKNFTSTEDEIDRILKSESDVINKEPKRLFNYGAFKKKIRRAKNILYLADNAGEIVFDKLLIEYIAENYKDKKIIIAVKEAPIINDALLEDARYCRMQENAEIVSCGATAPGTIKKFCSKKFLKIFNKSDMIISKGQGNFEALSDDKKEIFFLFMAKCSAVSEYLKCNLRDIILLHKKAYGRR